jgi:predicted hydrocarbon binding protein
MQKRFARLVELLNQNLDEGTRKKVFESLGRDHGREYRFLTDKYKGNIEGFLNDIRTQWVEKAEYDAAKGTIRIVDKSTTCTCPLVKKGLTPPSFCDCTLGWQEEVYSAVTGRPVEASVEESLLRGGDRCVFRMQIL